jgi:methylated-DNA-[protein]-cysteine S-methyltransferase
LTRARRAGVSSLPCSVFSQTNHSPKTESLKTVNSPSPFAAKVYAALREIPLGRVITYAALARRIGCPSPRAIGQALRSNPFAPQVPCHRVIASDLTPGGFQGHRTGPALAKKLRLLAAEGVRFKNNHLTDPKHAIR